LAFPVFGQTIQAERGCALYKALARIVPAFRKSGNRRWKRAGIMPITGRPVGERRIALDKSSRLTLRIDRELIKHMLPLAGAKLLIRNDAVLLGEPVSHPLKPASRLLCCLVVFKGVTEPEPFLEAVGEALRELKVKGTPLPLEQRAGARDGSQPVPPGQASALRHSIIVPDQRKGEIIGYRERIGFGVEIRGLSTAESLRVQELGIGGCRKFGCGIFVATRRGSVMTGGKPQNSCTKPSQAVNG
jgi:CRISPR-associated endonuclease/helicase Cas3